MVPNVERFIDGVVKAATRHSIAVARREQTVTYTDAWYSWDAEFAKSKENLRKQIAALIAASAAGDSQEQKAAPSR